MKLNIDTIPVSNMQFIFKFCHLSQHCPLELTFPTSPTPIQDCTFHLGVMSLEDFKNINQILLLPNFKLSAVNGSLCYSHTSRPFLSQTQGRTLPSWSPSALSTADPSSSFHLSSGTFQGTVSTDTSLVLLCFISFLITLLSLNSLYIPCWLICLSAPNSVKGEQCLAIFE